LTRRFRVNRLSCEKFDRHRPSSSMLRRAENRPPEASRRIPRSGIRDDQSRPQGAKKRRI
jgi:hypothetical protein